MLVLSLYFIFLTVQSLARRGYAFIHVQQPDPPTKTNSTPRVHTARDQVLILAGLVLP
jgi:hypothetical protein